MPVIKPIEKENIFHSETRFVKHLLVANVVMVTLWSIFIVWFFSNFSLRTPIIIQTPIVAKVKVPSAKPDAEIKPRSITVTPTPKKKSESHTTVKVGQVRVLPYKVYAAEPEGVDIKKIYQLESSSGRNDSCKNQGKFNGYGYGQNKHVWNCFDSFEEVTNKVQAWFDDKQDKGFTLNEQLCYYNQGIRTEDCHYAMNYHSL